MITDFVRNLNPGDVGFAALLALAIYLILTGRLVPKSTVDDMRADYVSRLKDAKDEADNWKEAYQLEAVVGAEQGKQIGELLELSRTSDHMIRSIQATAARSESGKT